MLEDIGGTVLVFLVCFCFCHEFLPTLISHINCILSQELCLSNNTRYTVSKALKKCEHHYYRRHNTRRLWRYKEGVVFFIVAIRVSREEMHLNLALREN